MRPTPVPMVSTEKDWTVGPVSRVDDRNAAVSHAGSMSSILIGRGRDGSRRDDSLVPRIGSPRMLANRTTVAQPRRARKDRAGSASGIGEFAAGAGEARHARPLGGPGRAGGVAA